MKVGKKITAAVQTFAGNRTKRIRIRQRQRTARVQAKQERKEAGRSYRRDKAIARQQAKVAKAAQIAAGGGYIGRQDAIGRGFDAAGRVGAAAVTGGMSEAGGLFGGGSDVMDYGSAPVSYAPQEEWYKNPLYLIGGAGLLYVLFIRGKK